MKNREMWKSTTNYHSFPILLSFLFILNVSFIFDWKTSLNRYGIHRLTHIRIGWNPNGFLGTMVFKFLWNCVPKIDPGPHICGRVTLWRWRRCRFPPIFYQLWSHHSRLQISTIAAPRKRCNRTPVVSAAEFDYWPICGIDDYSGRLKRKLEIDNSLYTKSIVSSSTYYSTNLGSW